MTKRIMIILLVLYCCICIVFAYSATVSLILKNNNRNWTSIICPPTAIGRRMNVTVPNEIPQDRSETDVVFQCKLVDNDNSYVSLPYHFSMFAEVDSSVLSECTKVDECFLLKLVQNGLNTISIHAKIIKTCFSAKIPFRYELRQGNLLVNKGVVVIILSRKPKPARNLHLQMNGSQILSIDGFIRDMCEEDVLTTIYTMTYTIKGGKKECQLKNVSICRVIRDEEYKVSCTIYTECEPTSMCSSVIVAQVVGVNRLNQTGDASRKFSRSLAFISSRSLLPNITKQTLNSLTLAFRKPVHCVSAHHHFQYKISYKRKDGANWNNFQGESCKSKELCNAHLAGLEMNTEYIVCVSYGNIFNIVSSFSEPACTNSSTLARPCQAPTVYRITPIRVNRRNLKAVLYWKQIGEKCWRDNLLVNSLRHYYRVEISDWNGTSTYRISSTANYTSKGLSLLHYHHDYSITLTSCNMYGCISGPKSFLHIKRAQSIPTQEDNGQEVTETVLICVFSLLFLAASTFLYFILKKRKQFQRLKLKRKLHANDIQLVREDSAFIMNKIPPRVLEIASHKKDWPTANTSFKLCSKEHMIITRPLLTTRSVNTDCTIPENSTLV